MAKKSTDTLTQTISIVSFTMSYSLMVHRDRSAVSLVVSRQELDAQNESRTSPYFFLSQKEIPCAFLLFIFNGLNE
jgi:hypothetical protein